MRVKRRCRRAGTRETCKSCATRPSYCGSASDVARIARRAAARVSGEQEDIGAEGWGGMHKRCVRQPAAEPDFFAEPGAAG